MYRDSDEQSERRRAEGGPRPAAAYAGKPLTTETAQELSDAMSDVYMPISPDAGRLLYSLIRAARPEVVVEFGMSFGISTLFLAAAVRDNELAGTAQGRVYTTELSSSKIARARATFAEAGLDDVITILEGDALTTLPTIEGGIDLVLLDGWKQMYRPVIELIEPRLPSGALVVADNTESPDLVDYLEHVRDPANGYVSLNFPGKREDTMELSCRV